MNVNRVRVFEKNVNRVRGVRAKIHKIKVATLIGKIRVATLIEYNKRLTSVKTRSS